MDSLIGKTFTDSAGQKWKVIFHHPYSADKDSAPTFILGAVRWMKRTASWGTNRTCCTWGGDSLTELLATEDWSNQ